MSDEGDLFAHGGEMGRRMSAIDWSKTPLGPTSGWQQSLRTCIRIVLTSRQPMFVWWGEELINLYNDAYIDIVGGKHPGALAQPASVVWREIWDAVGPRARSAMTANKGTYDEALLLIMERNGYQEETYYTFSYSPVPGDYGDICGILCANTDDTQRIVGARQLATLRELAASTVGATSPEDACARSAEVLAGNPRDLPFALMYLASPERGFSLAGAAGIAPGSRAAPAEIAPDEGGPWPLGEAARERRLIVLDDLAPTLGPLPTGAWDRPPRQVVLMPIAASGAQSAAGVLVVGLSPFRNLDEGYRGFLELISGQIATGIASAQAYAEEKRRVDALAELDRAKTQFFSNVSHEFRTPLTLILGPTEDALAGPERALSGEQLERVHGNAQRLLKLVNTLLEFSRVEAGRRRASFQPVDLATLTVEIANAFESVIVRADLRFVVDCPPLPEPVWVDPNLWEKVVLNLVSNAFKFTLSGQIAVRLRWTGAGAELTVADSGIGIAPEHLPSVFQRFHRIEGAQGRSHEGSGIGLSLVKSLVELHGGEVSVQSTVGVGTTFTVALRAGTAHLPQGDLHPEAQPVPSSGGASAFVREAAQWVPGAAPAPGAEAAEDEAGTASARPGAAAPPSRGSILLADDNVDMRNYVRRVLAPHFTVETVADGQAALELARAHPPDLVLSDVMMPRLDGLGLVRALRADPATHHVPIVLLSARAGEEATVDGLAAGADDYIVKPFGARELVARIDGALRVAKAETERRSALARSQALAGRQQVFEQQLILIVSRGLREPLQAIQVAAGHLAAGGDLSAEAARGLSRIEDASEHALRLLRELLDFTEARLRGGLQITPRRTDLHAAVRTVMDEAVAAFPRRHLEARYKGEGQGVWDPDRLAQMAHNLVFNALMHSPPDAAVRVEAQAGPDEVTLVVHNGGPPIPPEQQLALFEPLQHAGANLDRAGRSMGLGLYLVQQIVNAHGGTVTVRSTEAEGTTFSVRLPRRVAAQA